MTQFIHVGWKKNRFIFADKSGWDVPREMQTGELSLPDDALRELPRNIRDENAAAHFWEKLKKTPFADWWLQRVEGEKDKVFSLDFPDGIWQIPWELLLGQFDEPKARERISLTRTTALQPIAPSVFDRPMHSLVLLGDDGASLRMPRLSLRAEVQAIESAWRGLDGGIRRCVEQPIIESAERDLIPKLIHDHTPDLLWFSGHGLLEQETQLLLANGALVTAREFAELIRQSGHKPLYAIFWACDTGRADARTDTLSVTPALFRELGQVGVLAVIAMQAPIRDVSARMMAADLFSHLAGGLSLERALSLARANLMKSLKGPLRGQGHELDWACPVLWTASPPVEGLQWNSAEQPFAKFQLSGQWILRLPLLQGAVLEEPPSDMEFQRARVWSNETRVWVRITVRRDDADNNWNKAEPADKVEWLRTLQAIPKQSDYFVLPIILDAQDPEEALKRWAQRTMERLRQSDLPKDLAEVISQMNALPLSGWSKLCELPQLCLSIVHAPPYNRESPFWKPLLAVNAPRVSILSEEDAPSYLGDQWTADTIEATMDYSRIDQAVAEAPRLARALAILNMPLSPTVLAVESEEPHRAARYEDWHSRDQVLVVTGAGPVVGAVARQRIVEQMSTDEIVQAHRDCVTIILKPGVSRDTPIRERLVMHYLGAKEPQQAVREVINLCQLYSASERPFSLIDIFERLGTLRKTIPSRYRVRVAAAYVQLGKLEEAERWLRDSHPGTPLERAWKYALQHEIHKNMGEEAEHGQKALAAIESAIQVCQEALDAFATGPDAVRNEDERRLLENALLVYRQDRVRILHYFFAERIDEVEAEYRRLNQELPDLPGSRLNLAAVKRNLSDLLLKRATGPRDLAFQEGVVLLDEARRIASEFPASTLLAEVIYEQAKFAEKEQRTDKACALLNECIKAAGISHYEMLITIANNKRFWLCEQFESGRWQELERDLERFTHGWALRNLICARFTVAKQLQGKWDWAGALTLLEKNRAALLAKPSFDQGSDRWRIQKTYAGLAFFSQQLNHPFDPENSFLKTYPWLVEWVQGKTSADLEAFWEE